MDEVEINYDLLTSLADKEHPNLRRVQLPPEVHEGVVEVLAQARAVHHLLDMQHIPRSGTGFYRGDLDARSFLALRQHLVLSERLSRIGSWHARETGPAGMVGDFCIECGKHWPCDTYRMAEGSYLDEATGDAS